MFQQCAHSLTTQMLEKKILYRLSSKICSQILAPSSRIKFCSTSSLGNTGKVQIRVNFDLLKIKDVTPISHTRCSQRAVIMLNRGGGGGKFRLMRYDRKRCKGCVQQGQKKDVKSTIKRDISVLLMLGCMRYLYRKQISHRRCRLGRPFSSSACTVLACFWPDV